MEKKKFNIDSLKSYCQINNMKTLYVRNILLDLWEVRKKAAIFVAFCVFIAVVLALRPGTPANLSAEQKKELADYNSQIEEYDTAIDDLKTSIEDNKKQVSELKNYVDNAIYMQIDPQNIQTSVVQYSLQTGGNVGNILNSFITYINDGGLRESVSEEDKDLQPEYWRDIIGAYLNSNIINITVVHYDAEKCARIMEIVKQRIQEHVPEVKAAQGDFTLTELETSQFVKADAGIVNGQNGHRNNLKNYEAGLADLRNRLVSYRTNKANYIKNNEPDFAPKAEESPVIRVIKYLLVGIIMGVVIACAAVMLRYILSDRLRSAADLRDFGLNVLGICRIRSEEKKEDKTDLPGGREDPFGDKESDRAETPDHDTSADAEKTLETAGSSLTFHPEPARAAMDIKVLAEARSRIRETNAVSIDLLHEDEFCIQAATAYTEALSEAGMTAGCVSHIMDSAENLKKMVEAGACLLVAEAGKTTYQDLKQHIELCGRYQITVLGCVVIE